MIQGALYIISAPSGAGKSSLIQTLSDRVLYNITVSISHTTRAPRFGEVHGKHYFFVNHDEFKALINQGEFIEHAEILGNYYGSSRKTIEQILATGVDVFMDIDWQGAQQIRKQIPQTCSIFILPPSKKELNSRLLNRGQDDTDMIAKRMDKMITEINHYDEYDYIVVNDDFNTTLNNLKTIVHAERLRTHRQKQHYNSLITKLLAD